MAYAQGSKVQVLAGAETSYGTAQTSLTVLRTGTGTTLALTKDSYESEEIRSDRQVADYRHGVKSVGGEVGGELYHSDWDMLFEGLLGSTWSTPAFSLTSTSISFDGTTNKITAALASDWTGLSVGDIIHISGSNSNDGYAEVTDITDTDVTVAHKTLTTESAGANVTITNLAKLTNGTTLKSYTIEVGHTDIGEYHQYTGCVIDGGTITISANAMVKCSFTVVGSGMTVATSSLDSSPTSASTDEAYSGIDTSSITEGGSSTALVTDLTINVSNGTENAYTLGSDSARQATQGRCRVTGSCTMYFEDSSIVNKFLNETETSLQILMLDPDDNPFWIDLPRVKFNSGVPPVDGEGALTLSIDFVALRDDTTGKTIILAK